MRIQRFEIKPVVKHGCWRSRISFSVKSEPNQFSRLAKSLVAFSLLTCSLEDMGDLAFVLVRTDPLIFVLPSDHRLASHKTIGPQEILKEPFIFPSHTAPAVRRAVVEYFKRAGIDLKPEYEVHNVVHAISMITSTRAVMLLPAYTKNYLPDSVITRPVKGEVPTVDLVIAYDRANNSSILKLFLSRIGELTAVAM
jgi:LysR family transcriptional regulator, hca operon transcriptional activator